MSTAISFAHVFTNENMANHFSVHTELHTNSENRYSRSSAKNESQVASTACLFMATER